MYPSLRHLQIFRLFSRVLNVTETARVLRISQPTVSQALKELEAQLGVSLIIRGNGPLRLTADAQVLLKGMDDVLDNMQSLRDRAARLRGEHHSSLSVATVHPLTASILPRAIEQLLTTEPKARVNIEAHPSRDVVRMVKERAADIGFTFLPIEQQDLMVRPLLRTEMVCLTPIGHRLAGSPVIAPEDLRDDLIITLGTQIRQEFDVRLAFEGADDDARFITTNHSIVSADLVRQGVGVAITLPFVLTQASLRDIAVSAFRPEIKRMLVAVYLRQPTMSPLAKSFMLFVREELRQFSRELSARGITSSVP
ncbi:LysR family transcriptional regulator [Microvirga alba]|uniref:LysR family transcriptional regulator n=1 Tax=Microvirga alba TaxID=2791025 RepID=A0A931BUQ5_9HYPH|nr:LysR family transcriptional regulator [Microvirga alba]MBF9235485.1 LysR family transcriptional regulator [Microvirga alba]